MYFFDKGPKKRGSNGFYSPQEDNLPHQLLEDEQVNFQKMALDNTSFYHFSNPPLNPVNPMPPKEEGLSS